MNLGNLKSLSRAQNPGAKLQKVGDTVLQLIINQGAIEISAYTICLKARQKFDVVEDVDEYLISEEISDFLVMDEPGIWWNDGSNWKKLLPETLKSLDEYWPNWRDLTSGDPTKYTIDGDILTIVRPPDTALVKGFWAYYGKKPVTMTKSSHYPFVGAANENPRLTIFDSTILAYVKWQLSSMLNKGVEADKYMQLYRVDREEKNGLFNDRPDISSHAKMTMEKP